MKVKIFIWIKWCLFSLFLVSVAGLIMRYKIAYSLPFVDQKNMQHAHSHFAFSGWITQILLVLMIAWLGRITNDILVFRRYAPYLIINLVSAYGMLLSFPFQGYGPVSISFATLSILVMYAFAIRFHKDLRQKSVRGHPAVVWFNWGMFFNVISSVGPFALAYMLSQQSIHSKSYLASIYYFLHFQYNGWFLFASMGLLLTMPFTATVDRSFARRAGHLLGICCLPAYFLSVLWYDMQAAMDALVVIAAIVQAIVWAFFGLKLIRLKHNWETTTGKNLLKIAALCLTLKFSLQLASTIPALGELAFEFRPVVIAYLHLVFLGVITVFLLGFLWERNVFRRSVAALRAVVVFVAGIFLNEVILMVQGIGAITYTPFRSANLFLFFIAIIMTVGIFLLITSQFRPETGDDQREFNKTT